MLVKADYQPGEVLSMPTTTEYYADTTEMRRQLSIIDDLLRSLRISGSVLLREPYVTPWAIAIPDQMQLSALLGVSAGIRVVAFHLVEFGHCTIQPQNGEEILLSAGELAICFGGEAHHLSQGDATQTLSIEGLLTQGQNPRHPEVVGQTAGASLMCGAFMLHHTNFNPLFTALPAVLHARLSRRGELHNLSGVARLMAEELDRNFLGGGYVVERLLEVLCAEAIRAHVETSSRQETGWFRGIKDPVVGRAVEAIHARPGSDWSVTRLAADVAMSPSRFATRFTEALGDSPMAYVTKWRMNVACRQLLTTRQSIELIAANCGYESLAAFSRAFRKHVGISPTSWRVEKSS
jgi:AraC-like DNA-binding protein